MKYCFSVNGDVCKGPFESIDTLVAKIRENQFVSESMENSIKAHFDVTKHESLSVRLTCRNVTLIEIVEG